MKQRQFKAKQKTYSEEKNQPIIEQNSYSEKLNRIKVSCKTLKKIINNCELNKKVTQSKQTDKPCEE